MFPFRNVEIYITERMYATTWPMMLYTRCIGLFPLVVKRTNLGLALKWSNGWASYSCIYGLTIILGAMYGQMVDIFLSKGQSIFVISIIDIFPRLFSLVGYSSVTFCGIFVMSSKVRQFFAYINRLKKIDSIINTNYSKSDKYLPVFMIFGMFVIDTCLIIFDDYMAYQVVGKKIGLSGIKVRTLGVDFIAQMTYAIEYTTCYLIRSLERRFKQLNLLLEQHYLTTKTRGKASGRHTTKTRRICRVSLACFSATTTTTNHNKDAGIVELREAYLKLMDAQYILNDFLGLCSVIAFVSVLLTLVANPYFLIMILRGKRGGTLELVDRLPNFCWQINRVMLITEPWYACILKMETTKGLVCRLLSLKTDRTYKKEVFTFWRVLGLRQLQITPMGFFNIDRLLISTLIGNITTYVVILLQAHG